MQTLVIGSLDLDITKACNCRCKYCYLSKGPRGDDYRGSDSMSRETMLDGIELLKKFGVKPSRENRNQRLHLTFYGGEPMLAWTNIVWFIEQCDAAGLNLRYTIVSNGTIGTPEIVDFCRKRNIFVQRSIDGCPEAQEITRPGTIKRYEEQTKLWRDYQHTRRVTVTPETVKYLAQSYEYFRKQGFALGGSPMLSFYEDWTPEALAILDEEFWKLARAYVADAKRGRWWYIYWISRETVGRFWTGSRLGCGSGKQLWCLSWDGHLYTCHRFSSDSHDSPHCFGSAKDILAGTARGISESVQASMEKTWKNERPFAECEWCVAREGCDAGCYHVNEILTGDPRTPPAVYCHMQRLSARIVSWMDRQLRPLDVHWWARGNFRAKEYLRIVEKHGHRQCLPPSPPETMRCEQECPRNLNRSIGNCFLQAGPYQPMTLVGGTEDVMLAPDCRPVPC